MKRCLFLLSFSLIFQVHAISNVQATVTDVHWQVGFHKQKETQPQKWIPASVPGAVQLDFAKANQWGDYYYAENWKDYLWMEDVYWTYRTNFKRPDIKDQQRFHFVSNGIDYELEIRINDKRVHYQEGMFTKVDIDITDHLKENNELLITIFPAPKVPGKPVGREQAAQSVKPAVSYGWDWHPRLVPLGIWDETSFQITTQQNLVDFSTGYILSDDLGQANISVSINSDDILGKAFEWDLVGPEGKTVLSEKGTVAGNQIIQTSLPAPQLWWPHDHGEQPLYVSRLSLKDENGSLLDEKEQKIGFRQIRLVMNEGTWNEPAVFPKSRSNPPMTIEINDRRIFSKGTNWVNPEIFPGIITRKRYEELLDRALEANFNLLRVWGGGIVNKEDFYELCDEKGIMVWTEFPLACNDYEGTPKYLKVLKQEALSIIKRVKKHSSNVLWCGGNELFNSWSGMTDQSLALRLLNSLCYELDPQTPFIPTAPVAGVGHGNYVFRDLDTHQEVFEVMPKAHHTAYTEFGMPGPSSVEILKQIIPQNELFPPLRGTSWESHHAFGAWVGDTWLMKDLLTEYFGEAASLEELVANGQWMQSEGYKCIFEEARRQKPYCSMALNWCFNEPWPTAANNSLVNYPNVPKPAFYAVSASCRPVLASARIPKFRWKEGELFTCDLFILNDKYEEISEGKVTVTLEAGEQKEILLNWDFSSIEENKNLIGPKVRYILPRFDASKITLVISVEDHPEWDSEYTLIYSPRTIRKADLVPVLNQ